jgi:adenylosuccinate lyase
VIRRYTLPEMGAIWTEEARFEAMLRVELAVSRAQAKRGIVPAAALAALESRSRVDIERISEIERTTDHDVIAFVSQVASRPEGRYLHLGLTADVATRGSRSSPSAGDACSRRDGSSWHRPGSR